MSFVPDSPDEAPLFRDLLAPHYAAAFAFACHLAGSRAEGADLLHDALCHALERFDALRDSELFKPWLYRIVANLAHNRRRRARLFGRVQVALGFGLSSAVEGGESSAVEREGVQKVLDLLPRPQREALVLVGIAGETLEMVAEIQGVPLGTAKSRLREARRRFTEAWNDLDAPPILSEPLPEVQR